VPGAGRAQLPFALATVAIVFQGQADMVAIGFFGSLALAGVYGPLVRTAYSTLLSAEAVSWGLYGGAHPDEREDAGPLARRWRPLALGLGVVLAVLFALLAEPFLRLLLDRPLPGLTTAVLLFSLVVVARFVTLVLNVEILRAGRQRDEIPVLGLASCVLAVGGVFAARAHSIDALAAVRLGSELLIAGGYFLISRRPPLRALEAVPSRRHTPGTPLRLLFLTPFPPSLDGAHGGSRVIGQLLGRMAERHRVALLCLRHGGEQGVDDELRRRLDLVVEVERPNAIRSRRARALRGVRARLLLLAGRPLWATDVWLPEYRERLRELLRDWRPDVVQVEYTAMGCYLGEIEAAGVPAVLGEPDPPTSAAIDLGRSSPRQRLLRRLDVRAWRRFERVVLRRVAAAVVFTDRDARALEEAAGTTPVVRIPFGTDFGDRAIAESVADGDVLFVGNFVHPPNIDAATRLVRQIFPRVRQRHPGSSLHIVGDNPPPELVAAANDGVVVTGRVPDLVPYVERAAVVAAPIRFGGGMRVKVLEALAAGKPLVASPLAAEGLDVSDGEQLLTAETDDEFAERISLVLEDGDLRGRLGASARAWANENLTWDQSIAEYERLYERLLS
jgi:polysaccharide biosynthesis protein PslH